MSENKYIIDKDSLTGIADAIRNKLGNGASIDDPAAGYYPDPTKSTFLAKFTTVGGRHQTGNSRYTYIAIWGISASDMTAAFGDTICGYLRITSLGDPVSAGSDARYVEQSEFSIIPYMNSLYGTSKKFTWAKDATILLPIGGYYSSTYGQPSAGIMFMWQDSGNYKYNYDITVPDIRIEFLDQNQNLMTPAIGGFSDLFVGWSSVSESGDLTHTFEGEVAYSPIPFSIDDMQDKITNYLSKGGSSFEYPSGVSIPVPLQTHMNWSSSATSDYSSFWYDFDCTNISSLTFKYKALLPYNSNTGVKAKDLKFNLDVYYGSKIWHKSGSNEREGVTAVDDASLCSTKHEIVDFNFPNETAAGAGVYTTGDYSHTINVPNNTWITLNIKLSYGSNSYHKIGQLILYDFSVVPREA